MRHPECAGTYDAYMGEYDCKYKPTITCDECKYGAGKKDPLARCNQPTSGGYVMSKKSGQQPLTNEEIAERRQKILTAAVSMARSHGLKGVTRDAVADRAGVAAGSINRYFGTMPELMTCVMQEAVAAGLLGLIAQGLAHRHPVALAAPGELRAAAVASVGGDL